MALSANVSSGHPTPRELRIKIRKSTLNLDRSKVIHADAHRWRYAKVGTPLGEPYLSSASKTLFLGGDWCLDARVEAAWQSGTAIAEALLNEL